MLCCDLKKFTPRTTETILLLVSTFSTLGNTVSKASSLAIGYGGMYRGLLLGIGFFTSLLWIVEKMKEPIYVRSFASFMPLDTVVGLLFNLLTGVRF
jgi:hypothetical protein